MADAVSNTPNNPSRKQRTKRASRCAMRSDAVIATAAFEAPFFRTDVVSNPSSSSFEM